MKKSGKSQTCILPLIVVFTLTACESAQSVAEREAQFNGHPLSAVIARIGPPTSQTKQQAVWVFKDTHTNFVPVYTYNQYGQAILVGHNRQNISLNCTYSAQLNDGHVAKSHYDGNSCTRFAPKLKE